MWKKSETWGDTCFTVLARVRWLEDDTASSVWSVMREVDKERHRRAINRFFNTSLSHSLLEHPPHVSILQRWSCNLQQPYIYRVVYNL